MKPLFQLYLHDFGNLALQLIHSSENKSEVQRMAESMNHLFVQAGKDKQFFADVLTIDDSNEDFSNE